MISNDACQPRAESTTTSRTVVDAGTVAALAVPSFQKRPCRAIIRRSNRTRVTRRSASTRSITWCGPGRRANWEPAQIVKIHRTRDGHRYDVEFWFKKGGNYTCGPRYRSERLRPFNVDTCREHCFRLSSAPWSKRVDEAVCAYNRATRRRNDRFTIDWATAECVECI